VPFAWRPPIDAVASTLKAWRRAAALTAFMALTFLVAASLESLHHDWASMTEWPTAALFLPVTSVAGMGAGLGVNPSSALVLGLAFWPVTLGLSWCWLRRGPAASTGLALIGWMLVGFANPVTRLGLVMSA
jgi:hypothetical protein